MINLAILVGRCGREPEIRTTHGGQRVANLRVATSEFVKGEEKTEWHSVVVWDEHLIDVIERRVTKGTVLFLLGSIKSRSFQHNGMDRTSTEVHLDRFVSKLTILSGSAKPISPAGKPEWEDEPF